MAISLPRYKNGGKIPLWIIIFCFLAKNGRGTKNNNENAGKL
jgi:hypothetical protein